MTAFEHRLDNLSYIRLLEKNGSRNSLTQILGFKLKHSTSYELVKLTAILLREGLILIEDIWPHINQTNYLHDLLDQQQKSLDYNYQMLFKSIM
jgi:hypothetical protein